MGKKNPHSLPLAFGYAVRAGDGVGPLPFGGAGGRFFVWFKLGDTSAFGRASVWNRETPVFGARASDGAQRFGAAVFVSNLPFYPSPFAPSAFGDRSKVYNRDFLVVPDGWDSFYQGEGAAKSAGRFRRHLAVERVLPLAFALPVSAKDAKTELPFGFKPEVPYLFFPGLYGSDAGTPRVRSTVLDVRRASLGDVSAAPEAVSVRNAAQRLRQRPHGGDLAFSFPIVFNRTYRVLATVENRFAWGAARVFDPLQEVGRGADFDSLVFGQSWFSHFLQLVEIGQGAGGGFFEQRRTVRVSFGRQYVAPPANSFRRRQFSRNHTAGFPPEIRPKGWDSAAYLTRIVPPGQAVRAAGGMRVRVSFGVSSVRQSVLRVSARGIPPWVNNWAHVLRNVRQYVRPSDQVQEQIVGTAFGAAYPYNRDRAVRPGRFAAVRWGYTLLLLAGERVVPATLPPPKPGMPSVTDRVRYAEPSGRDGAVIPTGAAVRTNGQALLPPGADMAVHTRGAHVWKNRRFLRRLRGIAGEAYGTAFAAYAVRHIFQDDGSLSFMIRPPDMRMPSVGMLKRYVPVRGTGSAAFGTGVFRIRRNMIAPSWPPDDGGRDFGSAYLKKRNAEAYPHGFGGFAFSDGAAVQYRVRTLGAETFNRHTFGRLTWIGRRVRFIGTGGIGTVRVPDGHDVWTDGTPPFGTKLILLDARYSEDGASSGSGNGWDSVRFGGTGLTDMSVRDAGGFAPSLFSTGTRFFNNGILVRQGIPVGTAGWCAVSHRHRPVVAKGWRMNFAPGRPRVTPHTVWVMYSPPPKAAENNGGGAGYRAPSEGIRTGYPRIVFNSGRVGQYAAYPQYRAGKVSGYCRIENTRQSVRAKGVFRFRAGWNTFYPYTQYAELFEQWDDMAFGVLKAGFPEVFDLRIAAAGVRLAGFGGQAVRNRNQDVRPSGADMPEMGKSRRNDTPFMWQGLRVGEGIPTAIGGGDMLRFGYYGSVSYRNRTVRADGMDMFASEGGARRFDDRMTVRRASGMPPDNRVKKNGENGKPVQFVGVPPFGFAPFGRCGIGNKVRFIRPDGYSDQFRKGAGVWQR
ncbi:TPA: hypothetical protein ACKSX6_000431 [Neisseria gonorrhoeae]